MQSWVHMYDPGPPDGFGTCALEDQLEEQLLAETNKRLERDPDLSHAVSQRGPWRAPVLGGVRGEGKGGWGEIRRRAPGVSFWFTPGVRAAQGGDVMKCER